MMKSTPSKSKVNTVPSGTVIKSSPSSLFAPHAAEKQEPVKQSPKQTVDKNIVKKSKAIVGSGDSDLPEIDWC